MLFDPKIFLKDVVYLFMFYSMWKMENSMYSMKNLVSIFYFCWLIFSGIVIMFGELDWMLFLIFLIIYFNCLLIIVS